MDACESVLDRKLKEGLDSYLKKKSESQVSSVAKEEEKPKKTGRESLPPFLRSD